MNLDVLIPQIWYDFIGRVIPGIYFFGYCYLANEKLLSACIPKTSFLAVCIVLVFSYLFGALMGGIWFNIEDIFRKQKGLSSSGMKGLFHNDFEELSEKITVDDFISLKVNSTVADRLLKDRAQLIPFIYDLIQVRLPKMGARISKLRGELLLCGNLTLSVIPLWIVSITTTSADKFVAIGLPSIALAVSVLSIFLRIHLKSRYKVAFMDGWLFVLSDIKETEK